MIGDGSFSLFNGPARAIGCARDFTEAAQRLDIGVRAGLHTGECEISDGDAAGLAVHIGARVSALAVLATARRAPALLRFAGRVSRS